MDSVVLRALPTQIAGHGGILLMEDGRLCKPVQRPPKGCREKNFYSSLFSSTSSIDLEFRKYVPHFYGIQSFNGAEYIILQDVAYGFSSPNIMDVKIGRRTWGPDASPSKIIEENSKYIGTKLPFGYSILSIMVHSARGTSVKKYDKSFGKSLSTNDVSRIPLIFLDMNSGENFSQKRVLCNLLIQKLQSILEFFSKQQRKYILIASSVLLAYDASRLLPCSFSESGVNVKIIDFAHVSPSHDTIDDNFIFGLQNLISLFESSC